MAKGDNIEDAAAALAKSKYDKKKADEAKAATAKQDAAKNIAGGGEKTTIKSAEEKEQKRKDTAALLTKAQKGGIKAKELGLEAAQAAPVLGAGALTAMGQGTLRQRGGVLTDQSRRSQQAVADAATAVAEEEGRVAEEDIEMKDKLETGAATMQKELSNELNPMWDDIQEKHTGFWSDDEDAAYNEFVGLLDQKVVAEFGSTFRGGDGKEMFDKLVAISNGTVEAESEHQKALASEIIAQWRKAKAWKDTGKKDWW